MKKHYFLTIALIAFLVGFNISAADYYWVGGTGNWSEFGKHWATTSGGATFHGQVPTQNDDVYFDANSFSGAGEIVTIDNMAYCKSMDWSGATNTPDIAGWNDLYIAGSLNFIAGMKASYGGMIHFVSNTAGNTLNFSTVSLSMMGIEFNGSGEWVFMSDLDISAMMGSIQLTKGTFNTNGYTITVSGIDSWTNDSRAIIFGSSTINIGGNGLNFANPATLSLDAGTSNINMEGSWLDGLGFTYYNVSFNPGMASDVSIDGSSTFNVLDFTNANVTNVSFAGGSLNTIFDISFGATCSNRKNIKSRTDGTAATIRKITGSVNEDYLNIKDITIIGGATFTTNNGVDLGNVSGWTINSASSNNYYWVGGTGNWNDTDHWATVSGGAYPSGGTCVPTNADNVFFDANSFSAANQTVTIDAPVFCNNIDWTGTTNNPTLSGNWPGEINVFGSFTLVVGMSYSFNQTLSFRSTSVGNTITTAGNNINSHIQFDGAGGEWTLQDELNCNNISFNKGSLITSNNDINSSTFYSHSSEIRNIDLGSSAITLTSNWSISDISNLTFNAGTSVINMGGYIFSGGDLTYNDVTFSNSSVSMNGSNTFNILTLNGVELLSIEKSKIQTLNNLIADGNCSGLINIKSSTDGEITTISKLSGTIDISYIILQDVTAVGGATFNANNSIDAGNNTGWTFAALASVDYYWVGGSGNWTDANHWSLASGGVPNAGGCIPNSADNVFFDANSGFSNNGVTINQNAYCNNMDWTGAGNANLYGNKILYISGSLNFINTMKVWFNGLYKFNSNNAGNVINTASQILRCNVYFEGSGEWTLLANLDFTTYKSIYHDNGSLITNNHDITASYYYSATTNTRQLTLGSSTINVDGWKIINGTNMTLNPETSTINVNNNNSFFGGDLIYNDVNILAASNISISGGNTYNNLNIPNASSIKFEGAKTQTFNSLTIPSGSDCNDYFSLETINSGNIANFSMSAGAFNGDWLRITNITAGGGATFNATNSLGVGTTTGWNITSPASVDLYWIGNDGDWGNTNNWSLTSGGASYGCVPTSNDNVFFDANSFDGTWQSVNIYSTAYCKNMDWTGATNTPALEGSYQLKINGSLTLIPSMDISGYSGSINFTSSGVANAITSAGHTFQGISLSGSGTYSLTDNLIVSGSGLTFNNGTFNTSNFDISTTAFNSNSSSVRTLNLGSSNIDVENWNISNATNLTLNAGTSEIVTRNSSSQFVGGDLIYNKVTLIKPSWGSIFMFDSNTFNILSIAEGAMVQFEAGETQTTTSLEVAGSAGNYVQISSSISGNQAFISQTTQGFCGDWLKVKDISVGTQPFYAGENSVDLGGNSGWTWSGVTAIDQYPAALCEDIVGGGTVANVNLTTLESTIDGGNGSTHTWYSDANLTNAVASPNNATVSNGQVFYDEVDNGTCTSIAEVTYSVKGKATVGAGIDQNVCDGIQTILTATNPDGASISWDNAITDGVAFTQAVGTTTYTVTATLNGCDNTDDVDVTVNPLPTVGAGADQEVCDGIQTTLTASNPDGASISWDNAITDGVAFTQAVGTTTYTVTATLNGCDNTDAVDVTVNHAPVTNFTIDNSNEPIVDLTNTSTGADSYSWDLGDGTTGVVTTDVSHEYTTNNTFTVVLYATNSCGTISTQQNVTITNVTITNVNIASVNKSDIKIYPNPNNGLFNVELPKDDNTLITIINISGQIVYQIKSTSKQNNINIENYSKGVYFVRIVSDSINTTKQIIVE